MVNQEIATIFNNMSSYMEMNDDQKSFFRSRAFRKAAEIIDKFPYDLSQPEWYKDIDKLKKIQGIGQSTAEHIKEFVETGKVKDYENMKKESPVKLEELLRINGVGPKTILKLYKALEVTDVESLKQAAEKGQIAELEGFGEKSQQSILESIGFAILNKDRISIATADEQITPLIEHMKKDKNITKMEVAGSYRRRRETIGDVDILISSDDAEKTMEHFVSYKEVEKVLGHGGTKASIWLKAKIQVDLRVVPKESFGSALQYFTGNVDHNVKLRNLAISKKYKLSEYGLFMRKKDSEGNQEVIAGASEEDVYNKLGLEWVPPELREDRGEIDAAQVDKLPNLITIEDIKCDMQMHTTNSDGSATVKEMAERCKELGYEFIGITDHFGKLYVANAILEDEFDDYLAEIRKADKEVDGIKVLAGGEIEIGKEGELEFAKDKLQQLDFVVASVHFSTKMAKDAMTKRIITALKNPLTTILAHPTGRLIGQRPGFEFDYEEVFKVAKEEGVVLEINASPMRLDLNDELVKLAKDIGCKIIISTDAHSLPDLDNMHFGVDVARRGWLEKKDLADKAFLI